MNSKIKKFLKGKNMVVQINSKDELQILLSFVKKFERIQLNTSGKFPKYFHIYKKSLYMINEDSIIKTVKEDFYRYSTIIAIQCYTCYNDKNPSKVKTLEIIKMDDFKEEFKDATKNHKLNFFIWFIRELRSSKKNEPKKVELWRNL